jgi:hypothetical protein
VKTGVQGTCNYLKELDSGFAGMTKMGRFRLFGGGLLIVDN